LTSESKISLSNGLRVPLLPGAMSPGKTFVVVQEETLRSSGCLDFKQELPGSWKRKRIQEQQRRTQSSVIFQEDATNCSKFL